MTGKHRYVSDVKRPGMLFGKVLRTPSLNATRLSLDTLSAETMPGVVIVRDGDFVGVAAPDEHTANKAITVIRAEWKPAEAQPAARDIFDYLRSHPAQPPGFAGPTVHSAGSIKDGLAQADHRLETTHTVAYIAHAPPEPRAAVAEWGDDGRLTVWTGTQRPFGVRGELMEAFGLPEERVRVIVPDTGSGYGGKHTGEAGGAPCAGRRQAGQAGVDARRRVHLGLFPPRRGDRREERGSRRRRHHRLGVPQL